MAEIVPLVDYITRKRLASPLSFASGGNIYNAVSQGGVGNAADTLEAMLFGVEVPPEAFEQVTIFAFGSIAPISPPVLGAPTMGAAKNARLYWGATVLADFQAAATQNGVWAVTATVNKAGLAHRWRCSRLTASSPAPTSATSRSARRPRTMPPRSSSR